MTSNRYLIITYFLKNDTLYILNDCSLINIGKGIRHNFLKNMVITNIYLAENSIN